jgi:hypothetical protein
VQGDGMFLNWLEERLEPEQFKRLEKLKTNLVEIVEIKPFKEPKAEPEDEEISLVENGMTLKSE